MHEDYISYGKVSGLSNIINTRIRSSILSFDWALTKNWNMPIYFELFYDLIKKIVQIMFIYLPCHHQICQCEWAHRQRCSKTIHSTNDQFIKIGWNQINSKIHFIEKSVKFCSYMTCQRFQISLKFEISHL